MLLFRPTSDMGVVYMGAWRAAALLNVLKGFTGPYPFLCKIHNRFLILSVVGYSVTSSPIHSVHSVLYFHAEYDIRPF